MTPIPDTAPDAILDTGGCAQGSSHPSSEPLGRCQPLPPRPWFLYLLECRGGRLYAGITNRLDARMAAHHSGTGAKFTRAHPPIRLLASRAYADRSEASRAEYAIKQLPRSRKMDFLLHPQAGAAPTTAST